MRTDSDSPSDMNEAAGFRRYFTLEEAVEALGDVRFDLRQAHAEVQDLRDSVILSKRILDMKQGDGKKPTDAEVEAFHGKFEEYEEAVQCWVLRFAEKGIVLRDLAAGLIDFPYHSRQTGQDYFLCWRPEEDGIFYFHGIREGFSGRHPISLLPD